MKKSQVLMVMSAVMLAPHMQWYLAIPLGIFWFLLSYSATKGGD